MSAKAYNDDELKYIRDSQKYLEQPVSMVENFLATISAKDAEILDMSNAYYALKLELHEKDTEIERLKLKLSKEMP